MLIDTHVLIWHLRGHASASQRLNSLPSFTISAITWLELLQGFRNRTEIQAVQQSLALRHAQR